MTKEEDMKIAINLAIRKHWPKLVKDSKQIAGYNYEKYGEDLLAYALEKFLCDKSLEYQYQVCVIDNKLCNYIGRAMSMYIRSNSSPFWHKYRKDMYNNRGVYELEYEGSNGNPIDYECTYINEEIDSPEHLQNTPDCILWALNQIHWYYKRLLEDYYFKNMTYIEMHKKYNITLNSLKKDVTTGKKLIKELCQHSTL